MIKKIEEQDLATLIAKVNELIDYINRKEQAHMYNKYGERANPYDLNTVRRKK